MIGRERAKAKEALGSESGDEGTPAADGEGGGKAAGRKKGKVRSACLYDIAVLVLTIPNSAKPRTMRMELPRPRHHARRRRRLSRRARMQIRRRVRRSSLSQRLRLPHLEGRHSSRDAEAVKAWDVS